MSLRLRDFQGKSHSRANVVTLSCACLAPRHGPRYGTGQSFVDGLGPALYAGSGVVALGALAALGIKRVRRSEKEAYEAIPEAA